MRTQIGDTGLDSLFGRRGSIAQSGKLIFRFGFDCIDVSLRLGQAIVRGQDRLPLPKNMTLPARSIKRNILQERFFANRMKRTFKTEAELTAFAAEFGRSLQAGEVVGLSGPLGAGKTTFVRAVVQARLGSDPTSSPTFTFWHRYEGEPPIDHLDLYRIEDPREIRELGLEEAFDGASIALVEWWEHAPGLLPAGHYVIAISGVGDGPREITVDKPA